MSAIGPGPAQRSDLPQRHDLRGVLIGVPILAVAINLLLFTSSNTGLFYLCLIIPGVFVFGCWAGFRLSGRSRLFYFATGFALGMLTWLIFLGAWSAADYVVSPDPLISFVRVCLFATLLFGGGALTGDMLKRRSIAIDSALVATVATIIGAITGIVGMFN